MSVSAATSSGGPIAWNADQLGRQTVQTRVTALQQTRSQDEAERATLEPARQAIDDRIGGQTQLRELGTLAMYLLVPGLVGAGLCLFAKSDRGMYAGMSMTAGLLAGGMAYGVKHPKDPSGYNGEPAGATPDERATLARFNELSTSIDRSKQELDRLDKWASRIEKSVTAAVRETASFDANGDGKVTIASEGRRGGTWDGYNVAKWYDANNDGDITPAEAAETAFGDAYRAYGG